MCLSRSKICFLTMLVGAVYAAVPVDKTVKSRIENFKSQTVAKRNLEEALPTPSMMEFEIEEDSINEEQLLQRILSRVNTLKPHGQQWKASILPTTKHISRTRKSIFGIDNRNMVETSVKAQTYPYSTVVSLSSGCTGTLIGVQHVLTAAHCVHDGRRFLKQARNLRIGMLQRTGTFRWIKVRKIHLPRGWKTTIGKERIKYDYAVLKLRHPHSRPTMAIKPSTLKRGSPMQFAGFHSDKKDNAMWLSQCRVALVTGGAILSFCDGKKGISGSGVYVRNGAGNNNAVVGVVSAIGKGRLRGKRHLFNVVISLTPKKIRKIKKWIKRNKKKQRGKIKS